MSAIYILILVSLLVALGFLAAYIWAVRSGQYDDTTTPSLRILMDDPSGPDLSRRKPDSVAPDPLPGRKDSGHAGDCSP